MTLRTFEEIKAAIEAMPNETDEQRRAIVNGAVEFCLSANLTKTDGYVIAQLVAEHSKKYCTATVFKQTLNDRRLEEAGPPPGGDGTARESSGKPEIYWTGETTAEACDQAEAALVAQGGLYERLGVIVGLGRARGRLRDGTEITFPALKERSDQAMRRDLAQCVQFFSPNRNGGLTPCHPPKDLVQMIKQAGHIRLPVISGLIHTPTLRSDGSILQTPGFDERTGLFFDPRGVKFLPVLEAPTKEQAREALARIKFVFREIPYDGVKDTSNPSLSATLACALTALIRPSLDLAPGTAFDAPAPRSGKGLSVNIIHVIAYGHRAVVENWTKDEKENEKMLGAVLLAGRGALAIDNVEITLGGGLISKILTEERMGVRILGKSEDPITEPIMLVTITGNNLRFRGDITARLLKARIDAGMENPEDRVFNWDPVVYALEHRAELVHDVLTVLRAYIVSGERVPCSQWGYYVNWSYFVREPLVWLGEPDPVITNRDIKSDDPEREKVAVFVRALFNAFPDHIARTTKEIIAAAESLEGGDELKAALTDIAWSRKSGKLDTGVLGGWLGFHRDAKSGDLALRRADRITKADPYKWFIEHKNGPQPRQTGATTPAHTSQEGATAPTFGEMVCK